MKATRVTQILGTQYPLIQAPMSWITNASLVAAVSNAGGLGVLGPGAGHATAPSSTKETVERMRAEIRKTRALTDKPFGLNVIFMDAPDAPVDDFNAAWLRMALEEQVRFFVCVGNANKDLFALIRQHGGIVIHRPLTPTIDNMREAEALGADLLVATGIDEGGHLPLRALGTFTVVPTMVDAVSVPVLAAGGINDRRGINAAFALGAEGVFIGTRFIATSESPAAGVVKKKILSSGYDDMVPVSRMQRSIRTRTADRLAALLADKDNVLDLDAEISAFGGLRPGMLEGKMDDGIVSVNTGIDIIRTIPSVRKLVSELMED